MKQPLGCRKPLLDRKVESRETEGKSDEEDEALPHPLLIGKGWILHDSTTACAIGCASVQKVSSHSSDLTIGACPAAARGAEDEPEHAIDPKASLSKANCI